MKWLNELFGLNAKHIRNTAQVRVKLDGDGNPVIEPIESHSISLSEDGSLDEVTVIPDRFYHCGCNAQSPMGGQCGVESCTNVSCSQCFANCRCHKCFMPLCLEHAQAFMDSEGQRIILCRSCHGTSSRKRISKAIGKLIISPFVEIKDKK